jgi:hypothetical protein
MRCMRFAMVFTGVIATMLFCSCEKSIGPTSANHHNQDPLAAMKAQITSAADSIQIAVAAFRGKPFKRPVSVGVFTRDQYAALVSNQSDSTPQSVKDLYNRIFRLEGLLRPNADYFSNHDATISTETAGFYVQGTDSMYIVLGDSATGLTTQDSLALFHEFVHALQDQYFDLTAIDSQANSSDQIFAARFAVEGEAELLMDY